METKPVTREETFLNAVSNGETTSLEPKTREEKFLAKLSGADVAFPQPITRKEQFLKKAIDGMSSGGNFASGTVTVSEKKSASAITVTHNLGVKPKRLVWFVTSPRENDLSIFTETDDSFLCMYVDETGSAFARNTYGSGVGLTYVANTYGINRVASTEETIKLCSDAWWGGSDIFDGWTVTWMVWG